jgi:hypothetical protein
VAPPQVDLHAQSKALRQRALAVLESMDLLAILRERFRSVVVVGSVDLNLMTWPDIDIYVPVERRDKAQFTGIFEQLDSAIDSAGHCLVRAVFNDEWAQPRGAYGSGYYWGLRIRTGSGEKWKVDLWGWAGSDYSRKVADHSKLKAALEGCDRGLVLRLKSEAMQLPEFRDTITSWDIYQFVLSARGTTIDELREFCRPRS